jgi:hypothetical protein
MNTFETRKEGFEKKFALDQEQRFKAEVRRNRLLGLWAAERMGITGDAAAAYANEVVTADSRKPATPTSCARSWAIMAPRVLS